MMPCARFDSTEHTIAPILPGQKLARLRWPETETVAQASRLFLAIGGHAGTREVERVTAVQNRGFEGCAHGRPGSGRQVLLVEGETLVDLALEPGIFRENITTRGLS